MKMTQRASQRMDYLKSGGQDNEVGEHLSRQGMLNAVVVFEAEAYADPKARRPEDLEALKLVLKTNLRVARHIGSSMGFVRDNT